MYTVFINNQKAVLFPKHESVNKNIAYIAKSIKT